MIKREENTVYIATISGGKDSVTMCDLLLKNGYPVDYIIFNDTTNEYDEMYKYIEKLKQYFQQRYDKEITTTKPIRNFKDSILRKVNKSKTISRNGQYVGIPVANGEAICHLRKTLKIDPTDKWIRKNIKGSYKKYIGYTIDEKSRATNKNKNEIYPLIDFFNMSEIDCKQYLINQDMENSLYKYFLRTGCKLCPYKSETDWWKLYNYFKKDFDEAKQIEKELQKIQKEYCFFIGKEPLTVWEKRFKQGSLFDFSDEPLRDCFCKI